MEKRIGPFSVFFACMAVLLAAGQLFAVPRISKRQIRETDRRQKISITANYPVISGSPYAAAFNKRSAELVRNEIKSFKKDIGPAERGDRERSLFIGYSVGLIRDDLISIGFGASTDSGGVHPNSYSFVLNFDLKNGRELALADLFEPGSDHLRTISADCIRQLLKEDLDREWVEEGAGPDPKNYHSWLIKRDGILITFDAYQVAAYAYGPQEVLVPYRLLKPYLGKSGPLSGLVK